MTDFGILSYTYDWFYSWLFAGATEGSFVLQYANWISLVISTVIICAVIFFAFKLVTSIFRLVYYMFEG